MPVNSLPNVFAKAAPASSFAEEDRTTESPSSELAARDQGLDPEYRHMLGALLPAFGSGNGHTVLVTSSLPGEGTTTVASSLARLVGSKGSTCLLVDAHLSRDDASGPDRGPGLSEILRGEQDPETLRLPEVEPKVFVLHRGRSMESSLNLLRDDVLADAFRRLRSRFDWIVLDGPSVIRSPDSPVFARHSDGVILVVQAERTRTAVAGRAKALIESAGSEVVGVVLNRRRYPIPRLVYDML